MTASVFPILLVILKLFTRLFYRSTIFATSFSKNILTQTLILHLNIIIKNQTPEKLLFFTFDEKLDQSLRILVRKVDSLRTSQLLRRLTSLSQQSSEKSSKSSCIKFSEENSLYWVLRFHLMKQTVLVEHERT